MKKDFSERLQRLRKNAKLTQLELAEKAGVDISTLQKYELGMRSFGLDKIEKLADALSVPVGELLGISPVSRPDPLVALEIVREALQSKAKIPTSSNLPPNLIETIAGLQNPKAIDMIIDVLNRASPGWSEPREVRLDTNKRRSKANN